MSREQQKSILDLAMQAYTEGLDTPERIVKRLEKIIVRNAQYIDRRASRRRGTSFDELVKEDNGAIASAIVLLESLAGYDQAWLRRYTAHVVRYAIMFSADNDEEGIQEIIKAVPPMPAEEEE